MSSKPTIVCLCGSTKFKEEFITIDKEETLKGNIVLSVGLFGHSEGLDMTSETKEQLDELHKRKIDLADEVLVINVGGYIGSSTKSEIEYAIANNKIVRYLESVQTPLGFAMQQLSIYAESLQNTIKALEHNDLPSTIRQGLYTKLVNIIAWCEALSKVIVKELKHTSAYDEYLRSIISVRNSLFGIDVLSQVAKEIYLGGGKV